MKTTNINKQAMKLAHKLHNINKVMTSKKKSFAYFLRIAYKMLRNREHFEYVLLGISHIKDLMLADSRVSSARFDKFVTLYNNLRGFAPLSVRLAVAW